MSLLINPAIVVIAVQWVNQSVVGEACKVIVGQLLGISLRGNKIFQTAQSVCTTPALAAANRVQGHDAIVQTHPNELVRCIGLIVAVLRRIVERPAIVDSSWFGISAADHLGHQLSTKGSNPGHAPVPLGVRWELRQIGVLMVVVDAHRCEHGYDNVVMGEVRVEWAAKRKVLSVVCEGAVHAAVTGRDVLVIQASKKLLEVA